MCEQKSCKKIHFYLVLEKLRFALKCLILISFSNDLLLQLDRIGNSINLYGQIGISDKNVGMNRQFTSQKVYENISMYNYL